MTSEPSSRGLKGLSWVVHKFGGTSVANADCYLQVARILEEQLGDDDGDSPNLAIVVSAMGGKPKVTDLLLDSVRYASERDENKVEETLAFVLEKHSVCLSALFEKEEQERLLDIIQKDMRDIRNILETVSLMKWQAERICELVSGYGELWSAQILAALMKKRSTDQQQNCHFVYLDARRVIIVDEEAIQEGRAIEWTMSQERMNAVFQEEMQKLSSPMSLHFVVTGYVATNTNGVATTLQRDGSDYSAAILGRLLMANSISIWTDVDGVLSADPRRVPQAQVLPEVSYNEAMELAYFGAKVIHPKTMQPAISCDPQIPIYIRNTFNASFPGTRIHVASSSSSDLQMAVSGFSSVDDMALINVEGSGMIGVRGIDRRIFGTLEQAGISVVLISQGSSEHSVTFTVTRGEAVQAKQALEEEFARELKQNQVSSIDIRAPCSIIAAVGEGMSVTTGVAGRFFSALGDAKINVLAIAQGSSQRNISAVVWSQESTRALRAVHAAFSLSHNTVRVAIIGMGDVGLSLVKLLESRRMKLRAIFDIDIQVCCILPTANSTEFVCLSKECDEGEGSITVDAYQEATSASLKEPPAQTAFDDDVGTTVACRSVGGLENVLETLYRSDCSRHCVFDCTNDEDVAEFHAAWLEAGIDVVTANNTGMSGPKERRNKIKAAEKAYGKQSAKYLRQVTVAGGLPVLGTLRSLLHSGDKISRIDGIFTVVSSYIMYRISPPSSASRCSEFDESFCKGAFGGDIAADSKVGEPCSFSQALREAIALGLTEEDPRLDLNNEYTARVLMVLARELGMDDKNETALIQEASDALFDINGNVNVNFSDDSPEIDEQVKRRVSAAASRGCVLRNISSVDVKERKIEIRIVEVPDGHVFATTPPTCACVRFFTKRHRTYPLIIEGPSAGADSTASALLAELLQRTRGMSSPRSLQLTREGSAGVSRQSFAANGNSE